MQQRQAPSTALWVEQVKARLRNEITDENLKDIVDHKLKESTVSYC